MTNHHLAKFGVHGHCGSGDIMVLLCHKTAKVHLSEILDMTGSDISDKAGRKTTTR